MSQISVTGVIFCSVSLTSLCGSQPSAALWFVCLIQRRCHQNRPEVWPCKRMKRGEEEERKQVWNPNSLFLTVSQFWSLSILLSHTRALSVHTLLSPSRSYSVASPCVVLQYLSYSLVSSTLFYFFDSHLCFVPQSEPLYSFSFAFNIVFPILPVFLVRLLSDNFLDTWSREVVVLTDRWILRYSFFFFLSYILA